jgi:hypothetical protein
MLSEHSCGNATVEATVSRCTEPQQRLAFERVPDRLSISRRPALGDNTQLRRSPSALELSFSCTLREVVEVVESTAVMDFMNTLYMQTSKT